MARVIYLGSSLFIADVHALATVMLEVLHDEMQPVTSTKIWSGMTVHFSWELVATPTYLWSEL